MFKDTKIVIVMPAYNEEEIIHSVIMDIKKKLINFNYSVLILNDGSTDNTLKKLENFKSDEKILIIDKDNEGHGKTLIRGYDLASKMDVDYILQIDSDDQIPIEEVNKLMVYINNFDFISGYRHYRNDPFIRIIITNILKIIIFLRHGAFIKDSNVPFRLISKDFLKNNLEKVKNSEVPNILLSIIAAKQKHLKQVETIHKKRNTGVESIRRLKLLIFCFKSFLEVIKFKSH